MSSRSNKTLYVGNLPGDIREREVDDLFYKNNTQRIMFQKSGGHRQATSRGHDAVNGSVDGRKWMYGSVASVGRSLEEDLITVAIDARTDSVWGTSVSTIPDKETHCHTLAEAKNHLNSIKESKQLPNVPAYDDSVGLILEL